MSRRRRCRKRISLFGVSGKEGRDGGEGGGRGGGGTAGYVCSGDFDPAEDSSGGGGPFGFRHVGWVGGLVDGWGLKGVR
jgi:hypothetical protein